MRRPAQLLSQPPGLSRLGSTSPLDAAILQDDGQIVPGLGMVGVQRQHIAQSLLEPFRVTALQQEHMAGLKFSVLVKGVGLL